MNQKRPYLPKLLAAAACLLAASTVQVRANSYASSLTNNAGTVSFRLNDSADSVKVIGNNGALTIDLGALPRGLTTTNLSARGLTAGTFSVSVVKGGSVVPSLIGGSVAINSPRGVAVNYNPASPYFGYVYAANSAAGGTGANAKGDGIYGFSADLADVLGKGTNASTGGVNFAAGGASSPYRLKVGQQDDRVYVAEWSDATGQLWAFDPQLNTATAVLKTLTKPAVMPFSAANTNSGGVGIENNHGSVAAVEVFGSLAGGNLTVYTIDEDYQTDPTSNTASEMNSIWRYDIGAGPLAWSNAPNAKIATPQIQFVSQTMDLSFSPGSGYLYMMQFRSAGNEPGIYVVDTNGIIVTNTRAISQGLGLTTDFFANLQGAAASPDGKWLAALNNNNAVLIAPMVDGIPDLSQRVTFSGLATTASGRGIAFDRANNVYIVSSGIAALQAISLGFPATNVTSSDGTFVQTLPTTQVSATLSGPDGFPVTELGEQDTNTVSQFVFARENDNLATPLQINFTLTGTATRGNGTNNDYFLRTNGVVIPTANTVTIPAGQSNVVLEVVPFDDNVSELPETIILTLAGGTYFGKAPLSGTIQLGDADTNSVEISTVNFNQAFEGNTNDFIRFTLQRRGDTNTAFTVNLGYSGSATADADFIPVTNVVLDATVRTKTVDVFVLNDLLLETNETIIARVIPGTGYLVGTNLTLTTNAVGTIVEDDLPTETVLFADNFNTDTSANWKVLFGSITPETQNYTLRWGVDYAAEFGIPPAPHSTNETDTIGILVSVNKPSEFGAAAARAAGVNLYPNSQSFTGNFALRFDMYLMQNGSAATTEHATFGINHSGNQTNWLHNLATPTNWLWDGFWSAVVADASALPAADYVLYAGRNAAGTVPTTRASRLATALINSFHNPPWSSGGGGGSPGNTPSSPTKSWAQVELSQMTNLITLKINNTTILSFLHTNAVPVAATNGNIMLGYNDAYDSVGTGGGGFVIYDNVRVVRLATALPNVQITTITRVGSNIQIDFTGGSTEAATGFKLYSSATVNGAFTEDNTAGTVYSSPSAGTFRIVTPQPTGNRFYTIRRTATQ